MQLDSEDPWTFGQSLQREALALNSVQSRDEEQIHIHVCTGNSGVKKRLSSLDPEDYKTLQEVPKTSWKCRVNPKVGGTINGVTAEIRTAIHFASCKEEVGAAVIVDNDDRSWMCIAEEWGAIEHTFCQ
jgi:CDP-diacylglycerol pyrophosphatase